MIMHEGGAHERYHKPPITLSHIKYSLLSQTSSSSNVCHDQASWNSRDAVLKPSLFDHASIVLAPKAAYSQTMM